MRLSVLIQNRRDAAIPADLIAQIIEMSREKYAAIERGNVPAGAKERRLIRQAIELVLRCRYAMSIKEKRQRGTPANSRTTFP